MLTRPTSDMLIAVHRLPRIVLNVLTLLASVLILVIATLWFRSYVGGGEYIGARLSQKSTAGLLSIEGRIRFVYAYYQTMDAEPSEWVRPTRLRAERTWTFVFDGNKNRVGGAYHGLTITHWLAILLLSPLPFAWAWLHRPKTVAGECARCGYDLRATPDRCPECGHVATYATA